MPTRAKMKAQRSALIIKFPIISEVQVGKDKVIVIVQSNKILIIPFRYSFAHKNKMYDAIGATKPYLPLSLLQ